MRYKYEQRIDFVLQSKLTFVLCILKLFSSPSLLEFWPTLRLVNASPSKWRAFFTQHTKISRSAFPTHERPSAEQHTIWRFWREFEIRMRGNEISCLERDRCAHGLCLFDLHGFAVGKTKRHKQLFYVVAILCVKVLNFE